MAVTNEAVLVAEAGNGVKVAFDFAFKIFAQTDLLVYKATAAGVYTLQTLTTHYTVSFDTAAETGTVTFVTAPVNGGKSVIIRSSAQTQGSTLPREGPMPEKVIENALDRLTLEVQELQEQLDRAPLQPIVPAVPAQIIIEAPVDTKGLRWRYDGATTKWYIESTDHDPDEMVNDAEAAAAAAAASQAAAAVSAAAAAASAASIITFSKEGTFAALDVTAGATWFIAHVTDLRSIMVYLGNRSFGNNGWITLGGY